MANKKHLLHVKSNQPNTEGNGPKLPLASDIDYGEIAINYLKDNEKISIKNSNNEIVTFETEKQTQNKINIVATSVVKVSESCGLDESLNYTPDSTNTLIKDTTNITEAVNTVANRINEIDEVTSKAFDTMNKSCGFNEEMTYIPQNELIQGTTSLAEAIEIVAEKANSGVDTSTLATKQELSDGLATKQDKGDYALKSDIPDVYEKPFLNIAALLSETRKFGLETSGDVTNQINTLFGSIDNFKNNYSNYVYVNNSAPVTLNTNLDANNSFMFASVYGGDTGDSVSNKLVLVLYNYRYRISEDNLSVSGSYDTVTLTANGSGVRFLSDNGTYKEILNSVNISDIFNRLIELAEVKGTCTEEDYNALKGYADNGIVTYVNMNGVASHIDIQNLNNTIMLRVSRFDGQQDTIQQCFIGSNKAVVSSYTSFLGVSIMGSGLLGSYTKPSAYSTIRQDDTISKAIGKLEAGLGSSSGIEDAPSDDFSYMRRNGEWVRDNDNPSIIEIDQTISDPSTMITGDVNGEVIQWIRQNSHRVLAKNTGDGTVTYMELDDSNSNKYAADGSEAKTDGTEGDVFVKLPTFYYHGTEGDNVEIKFSKTPFEDSVKWDTNTLIGAYEAYNNGGKLYSRSGVTSSGNISQANFKSYAAARGVGYQLVDWQMHCVMGCLFYAMYGNTNSQSICGSGTDSYTKTTGATNSLGMNDTKAETNGNTMSINFWGLENWWGNKYEWIEGIESTATDTVKILSPDPSSGRSFTWDNGSTYGKHYRFGKYLDLSSDVTESGSSNTYYCDYNYGPINSARVVRRSSYYADTFGGVSYALANNPSSNTGSSYGSRLAFRGICTKADSVEAFKSLQGQ